MTFHVLPSRQVLLRRPGVIEIEESPPLERNDGVLVGLRLAGICGTDRASFRGSSPLVTYPRIPGHELVVDVLEQAQHPKLEGSRAVVEPLMNCRTCSACLSGRYNACSALEVLGVHVDGGLRDESRIRSDRLHPVPADMPDELAVLAEPTSVAYHAVQRSAVEPESFTVVFGAGPIGLLIAQLLIGMHGCRVLVLDRDDWRLTVATAIGASVLAPGESLVARVTEETRGGLAARVFEATGDPDCLSQAIQAVAVGGKVTLVGWNATPSLFDSITFMRKEAELVASRNSYMAFPAVLQLLSDGLIDGRRLITHRYDLVHAADAFALLDGSAHAIKVVISR